MFTGDTLFADNIGRCDLWGGSYATIRQSLKSLRDYDGTLTIYPGHGEDSTIGHESMYNPFVVEVLNNEVNYKN